MLRQRLDQMLHRNVGREVDEMRCRQICLSCEPCSKIQLLHLAPSPQESVRKARNAADKALEIDPMLAEAYASRAHVKWKERDWAGADEDFKHSIELNGNYSNAHRFYAIYLVCMGRSEEAVRDIASFKSLLDVYGVPVICVGVAGAPDQVGELSANLREDVLLVAPRQAAEPSRWRHRRRSRSRTSRRSRKSAAGRTR